MAEEEQNGKSKIRVTDRRVSRQEETEAAVQEISEESASATTPKTSSLGDHTSQNEVRDSSASETGTGEYPSIDFNTFVLSLSTSALVNIGVVQDPSTGQTNQNFQLAKQTIDLIGLLEEKTKGNLSGEEERLMSQILYDLRMRYVAATKESSPS